MIKKHKLMICCVVPLLFCTPYSLSSEVILTFDEAVSKTLAESPKLRIADSELNERIGEQIQSGVYLNPIVSYSVEDVLGNKNWRGWRSAESRYELAQPIEVGGQRTYKMNSAAYQYYASQAGYEAKKIALLNRLFKLFVTAVSSQENLELALEQTRISEEVYQTVVSKVEAGKVSKFQQNKAEIALLSAKIHLEKVKADLVKNKERLSLLWGTLCPDFDRLDFPFYEIEEPVAFDQCLSTLGTNPEIVESQMQQWASHKRYQLAKSEAIPDVVVTVGYKTIQDTGNKGLILGASIPLPVFDRNQGNIVKARAASSSSQDRSIEIALALENKLSIAHKDLLRAYREAELIRTTVMTTALQSFDSAKDGYKEGKFEYLDMLDSQRTFFEVKERYILALLNYHQSKADIEYLNTQEEVL